MRRNVKRVEDRFYLSDKRLGVFAKRRNSLLDVVPIFLGGLFQHATRLPVHLRHAGSDVECRIVVGSWTPESRHPGDSLRQESAKGQSVRTPSRPAEHCEPTCTHMTQHVR